MKPPPIVVFSVAVCASMLYAVWVYHPGDWTPARPHIRSVPPPPVAVGVYATPVSGWPYRGAELGGVYRPDPTLLRLAHVYRPETDAR